MKDVTLEPSSMSTSIITASVTGGAHTDRFEGLVAAALGHGEDFELSWHHSGWVFQQLEVWLCFFLLLLLLVFILLLLFTLLDLLRQRSRIIRIRITALTY